MLEIWVFVKPTKFSLFDAFSTQNELATSPISAMFVDITMTRMHCFSACFLLKTTTIMRFSWLLTLDQDLLSFPREQQLFLLVFLLNQAEKSTHTWWDRSFRVTNYRPPPSAAGAEGGVSRTQVWKLSPCGAFDSFCVFLSRSNLPTRPFALSSSYKGRGV